MRWIKLEMLWCLFLISFDSFGYPDPTYLVRVTEELREKGITAEWRQWNNEKKRKETLPGLCWTSRALCPFFKGCLKTKPSLDWRLMLQQHPDHCARDSFVPFPSRVQMKPVLRVWGNTRGAGHSCTTSFSSCYNLRSHSEIRYFMFYWSFLIWGYIYFLSSMCSMFFLI